MLAGREACRGARLVTEEWWGIREHAGTFPPSHRPLDHAPHLHVPYGVIVALQPAALSGVLIVTAYFTLPYIGAYTTQTTIYIGTGS